MIAIEETKYKNSDAVTFYNRIIHSEGKKMTFSTTWKFL